MGWLAAKVPQEREVCIRKRCGDVCSVVAETQREDSGSLSNREQARAEGQNTSAVRSRAFGEYGHNTIWVFLDDRGELYQLRFRRRFDLWLNE